MTQKPNSASYPLRALAAGLDCLIFFAVLIAPWWWIASDPLRLTSARLWLQVVIGLYLPFLILHMWYVPFFIHRFGGTIGKLILGLSILDQTTHQFLDVKLSLFREFIAKPVSLMPFYAGVLFRLRHPHHLTWHDELAGSTVVALTSQERIGVGVVGAIVALVFESWLIYQILLAFVSP